MPSIELDSRRDAACSATTRRPTPRSSTRRDVDLGSTSPVLLGGGFVAQGGKDGTIRLLDWQRMRGHGAAPGRRGADRLHAVGHRLFTAPAVWHAGGDTWLFAADNGGTAAWTFSGGKLTQAWNNGNGGTSPVVAGGLLFVYDPGGGLRVYDAGHGHVSSPTLDCGARPLEQPHRRRRPHRPAGGRRPGRRNSAGIVDIWRVPKK